MRLHCQEIYNIAQSVYSGHRHKSTYRNVYKEFAMSKQKPKSNGTEVSEEVLDACLEILNDYAAKTGGYAPGFGPSPFMRRLLRKYPFDQVKIAYDHMRKLGLLKRDDGDANLIRFMPVYDGVTDEEKQEREMLHSRQDLYYRQMPGTGELVMGNAKTMLMRRSEPRPNDPPGMVAYTLL